MLGVVLLLTSFYFASARLNNPATVGTLVTGGAPTAGSVIFSDGTLFAEDNINFFYDNTNNGLGIGSTTPGALFSIHGLSGNTLTQSLFSVATSTLKGTSTPFTIDWDGNVGSEHDGGWRGSRLGALLGFSKNRPSLSFVKAISISYKAS